MSSESPDLEARSDATGRKAALSAREVWAIRERLEQTAQLRDLALFNLAIDSKLRGCDLVRLRVEDVAGVSGPRTRARITRWGGAPVLFEITPATRTAQQQWIATRGLQAADYLFPSRRDGSRHLSTRQYARIVRGWAGSIGLDPDNYGAHSLRRTKATLVYRQTGNLRAAQLLLGHSRANSTIRYLGLEVEDALRISEQIDL
jgi:integrase